LFFTENPQHFPESDDVAVILPELVRHFAGRFTAAVIDPGSERELHRRYNFTAWPSLVFVRRGAYLGAISRVRDWHEYVSAIEEILAAQPRPAPHRAVPIVPESGGGAAHGDEGEAL
jgi:hydrogenase-1 operon protein HyaE